MPIAFTSTRRSKKIDYSDVKVVRSRAAKYEAEAIRRSQGYHIVGRFLRVHDRLTLAAVPELPGRRLDDTAPLTIIMSRMYRWCTRQAARQWLIRRPHLNLAIFNTESLWDPRCPADNAAAPVAQVIQRALSCIAGLTTSSQEKHAMPDLADRLEPCTVDALMRCLARDYPPVHRPPEINQLLKCLSEAREDQQFHQPADPPTPAGSPAPLSVLTDAEMKALQR